MRAADSLQFFKSRRRCDRKRKELLGADKLTDSPRPSFFFMILLSARNEIKLEMEVNKSSQAASHLAERGKPEGDRAQVTGGGRQERNPKSKAGSAEAPDSAFPHRCKLHHKVVYSISGTVKLWQHCKVLRNFVKGDKTMSCREETDSSSES